MAKPDSIRPVRKDKHVFFGLFALPGVGKTRLVGEHDKPTLLIRPPTDHPNAIRPQFAPATEEWVVDDWNGMNDVESYLLGGGAADWDWVWLDNISLFQDHGVDDIFEQVVQRHPHRAEYGADKGEYGRNMERLARWMRHVVGADTVNFGYTAHPMHTEIGDDNKLGPYVQGKNMTLKIMGYMNMVAYMEVKPISGERRRVLRFRETDEYLAKDQFNAFPKGKLVDPTMPKFMAAVNAARSGQGSAPAKRTVVKRNRVKIKSR